MKSSKTRLAGFVFLVFGFIFGVILDEFIKPALAYNVYSKKEIIPVKTKQLYKLYRVWDLVQKKHLKAPFPNDSLADGAARGLVDSLGDPHSFYLSKSEIRKFRNMLNGDLVGIGVRIKRKDGWFYIVSLLEGGPAQESGLLLPGDIIYKVDGKVIQDISLQKVAILMSGKAGSQVIVTIYREGVEKPFDVCLVREKIKISPGRCEMLKNGVLYIKLASFSLQTQDLMNKAMSLKRNNKTEGIVFDLRDNPGGYLKAAKTVCSKWLFFFEPCLQITNSLGDTSQIFPLPGIGEFYNIPTVVLVNEDSASAAEIVAGALQDYNRAVIVGKTTYGKGTAQQIFNLFDGSAVKITVSSWKTPKGNLIQGKGIKPDVEVGMSAEDLKCNQDTQLNKAIFIILSKIKTSPDKKK